MVGRDDGLFGVEDLWVFHESAIFRGHKQIIKSHAAGRKRRLVGSGRSINHRQFQRVGMSCWPIKISGQQVMTRGDSGLTLLEQLG